MTEFDEARLDDPELLRWADRLLRPLAEAGARVRRELASVESALTGLTDDVRPRAVIVVGPEARFLRAVMEPTCPVPLVAWPGNSLPGWVGPLDVVVVLGGSGNQPHRESYEAVRRGSRVILTGLPDSPLARQLASRATTLLPTYTGDPLASAIVALAAMHALGLGPSVNVDAVAGALDAVAEECSYRRDVANNPAKDLAIALADAQPIIWGGSVLASRASRRIVEAVRAASGRLGLAADADSLVPLLSAAQPRDPFADPFEEGVDLVRPGLVLVDDGYDDPAAETERYRLADLATAAGIRVSRIAHRSGSAVERYVTVLQRGLFAAAYLQVGLGRTDHR